MNAMTQAHRDVVEHALQTGAAWPHQYALDCGWDLESIQATARDGASEYDIEALGDDAAEELVQWCRRRLAAE